MLYEAEVLELTKFHSPTTEKLIVESNNIYNAFEEALRTYEIFMQEGFVKYFRIRRVKKL